MSPSSRCLNLCTLFTASLLLVDQLVDLSLDAFVELSVLIVLLRVQRLQLFVALFVQHCHLLVAALRVFEKVYNFFFVAVLRHVALARAVRVSPSREQPQLDALGSRNHHHVHVTGGILLACFFVEFVLDLFFLDFFLVPPL